MLDRPVFVCHDLVLINLSLQGHTLSPAGAENCHLPFCPVALWKQATS